MARSGITWSAASLDRFLADPLGVVPGTKMTFAGVTDPGERADLVAWLVVATADPARCGTEPAR
jgi:cytochrome c